MKTLDTTGEVVTKPPHLRVPMYTAWADLTPFMQGYVEAAFASLQESTHTTGWAFRHLAADTLTAMIADCARMGGRSMCAGGRAFWRARQKGFLRALNFPPLTLFPGEDGKVHATPTGDAHDR